MVRVPSATLSGFSMTRSRFWVLLAVRRAHLWRCCFLMHRAPAPAKTYMCHARLGKSSDSSAGWSPNFSCRSGQASVPTSQSSNAAPPAQPLTFSQRMVALTSKYAKQHQVEGSSKKPEHKVRPVTCAH